MEKLSIKVVKNIFRLTFFCKSRYRVQGGELFDRVIDDDFVLTEKACSVFVRQVCQAVEFVHRNNILHLDLKPGAFINVAMCDCSSRLLCIHQTK